ncbi:MAG: hypothetical protein E6J91_44805, partial [Deltaproteobacteria bacterium]
MQPRFGRIVGRIATALAAAVALFILYQLYTGGNAALAAACAGGFGLAIFVYTARGTYTYRYLFPGLAGIAMFIILPLAYTVWIGFTNYSSRNLLGFDRVTEVLLGEVFLQGNVRYQFTLHAAPGGFRIVLHTGEEDAPAAEAPAAESSILDEPPGSGGSAAPAAGTAETAGSGGAGSSGTAGAGSGTAGAGSGSAGTGSGSAGTGSGSAGTGSGTAGASSGTAGAGSGTAGAGSGTAGAGSAAGAGSPAARPPTTFVTGILPLTSTTPQRIPATPLAGSGIVPGDELPLREVIAHADAIKALTMQFPDGTSAAMASLREFTPYQPLYQRNADGTLTNRKTGERLAPNFATGFYETPSGAQVSPGFRVNVGIGNYVRMFTDQKFRGPFLRVFLWTVVFAGLSVV